MCRGPVGGFGAAAGDDGESEGESPAEGEDLAGRVDQVPLLRGKVAQRGRATAYVCENQVCKKPTSDPGVFEAQIRVVKPLETSP